MIRYTLKCENDHRFESWFQSAEAFDGLLKAGHVECAICGTTTVEKSLMAPRVRPARKIASQQQPEQTPHPTPDAPMSLSLPSNEVEEALRNLREAVENNSDYVGESFAAEARKMHSGEVPERAIYGEAKPDEARDLIEDGVPITPLPFKPKSKAN